jgi:CubicO group peptidase (beta-lactamase class C family)
MTSFEPVLRVFDEIVRAQPGTGAGFCVWHDGAFVVDAYGGFADAGRTREWRRDSIVQSYSVSKPFAAMCALLLVDRGKLDLDAPMSRYWPEFRAPATVRHVLSHQAGVVALSKPAPTEIFYDWDGLCALLADQEPEWEPGTALGESALFYGHLVGELVRRVDGRTLGEFLQAEICGPEGLDFSIGVKDQARIVDLTGLENLGAGEKPDLYRRATENPPGAFDATIVNGAAWRAAEIPAVNGHGTARGVCGLYAALMQGKLLSADLFAEATTAQCTGVDRVFGHESAWGLGFGLDDNGYGMGGSGGNYGGACPKEGYAIAFVTGSVGGFDKIDRLDTAVRDCLGLSHSA